MRYSVTVIQPLPISSMSESGHHPGRVNLARSLCEKPICAMDCQLSRMSPVVLRGQKALKLWDPVTGNSRATEITAADNATVHLTMPPVTALFYIQE